MPNITITASANSTPPANSVIATCALTDSSNAQLIMITDASRNIYGVTGSPLPVSGSFSASVTSASVTVINNGIASPVFTSTCVTNFGGSAAGSPLFTSVTNPTASVLINNPTGSVLINNPTGSVLINNPTASIIVTNLTGSAAGSPTFVLQTNQTGSAIASPMFVSACITNLAGSATGSPLFVSVTNTASVIVSSGSVVVTNQVSASISNSPSVIVSSGSVVVTNSPSVVIVTALASPIYTQITDGTDGAVVNAASRLLVEASLIGGSITAGSVNILSALASPVFSSITNLAGSAAGSPIFVSQNNMTGSAAGSPIFSSITNLAGSAAGSPLFVSTTNQQSASISGGSVALLAGANIIGSASVIQSTPTGIANAWPIDITDGTDTAQVDAGSRLNVYQQIPARVTFTLTRPPNTTAYAAGDMISSTSTAGSEMNANGFSIVNGGTGRVVALTVVDSTSAATPANLEVWLFSASYTANNDNAAWAPADADSNNVLGIIQLGGTPIPGGGNNAIYQAQGLDIPYVAVSGSTSLWWGLVVRNAYTPTSAEVFKFNWGVVQYS